MGRIAKLIETQQMGSHTRLLTFRVDEPLGFIGGKWLMVNSGLTLPDGKAAKRAYSILSSDENQLEFSLAVRRIENGVASGHLHDMKIGDDVEISGPYGKLFHIQDTDQTGPLLLVATDTGITAALGILLSERAKQFRAEARLLWFVTDESYFLPESFVRENLPREIHRFEIIRIPEIKESWQRSEIARAALESELKSKRPGLVFLSGDGNVVHGLAEVCLIQGVDASFVRIEPFFNTEKKKPSLATLPN